ncbi:hypothetical protein [Burkholderia stagnalis]
MPTTRSSGTSQYQHALKGNLALQDVLDIAQARVGKTARDTAYPDAFVIC